ncbi:TetR/AcrR family transcriptional regulator [Actinophytocola algeriensis]|jgi:AcrR family transcriptional regulator|uniref:AcrR family transcriptional regulator n=1 Tax=Actinophytocola algeriensis TaxID=1768010 RepID=A0A7W7Q7L2_9PSEU|nr:TetR family transcriptional regulator [Actinophytocola algeriensis]MBB4908571.1 AcrR family transcriptional regulator [Actinophytocola algeriensis]MBE1475042.1 AcrR family transcriptional regulator [Actinophytocola algeriensis]
MGTDASAPPPTPDTAGGTRLAILRAARKRFTQGAFAEVGLREIAQDSGVSAALIVKYFGSKENLFAEAVSFEAEATALLDRDIDHLGEHLVATLLDLHDRASSDPFLRAVMAAFRPNGAHFSGTFQQHFAEPLAARLTGADVPLRTAMICAHLAGLGAVRLAMKLPGVTTLSPPEIVATFGPLLQDLITPRS